MQNKLTLKDILGPMRLPFLLLPPVCVALGTGVALWRAGEINWWFALLALVGGISTHVSVNAFNEYFDFKSGLDATTSKTPFSGGSGTLPARPQAAAAALTTAIVALIIPVFIGAYFVTVYGMGILPLGILGAAIILLYTTWITRNWLLCLLAPGIGFGVLMVMGTDYVLTGSYSVQAALASLVPTFLVSNLLLLNQFPDAEADSRIGRRHLPVVAGRRVSSLVFITFLGLTYAAIVASVILHDLPAWSLLGLATVFIAIPAARGSHQFADDIPHLIPHMGQNVLINLLTPLLMAVGLFIASCV